MHLGPYELQGELGRGGMAVVHRAVHVPTGASRAVKVLETSADAEGVLRFRREAETLARVEAPGIVRVFETGHDGGRWWFAMPLLEGGSLAERLRPGERWSARSATELVLRLAAALGRCHALGLVHRDVKPGNVLFDAQGEPHVSDFGLVRDAAARSLTASGTILGTLAYMAPEQLRGERVGPAADVFALGVILHELLAGERPFPGATPLALARAHEAPPPLRGAPPELARVLASALALDPARRPPDGRALAQALRAASAAPALRSRGQAFAAVGLAAVGLAAVGLAAVALRAAPARSPALDDGGLRTRADDLEAVVAAVRLGGRGDAATLGSARALLAEVGAALSGMAPGAAGRAALEAARDVVALAEAEALLAAGDVADASSAAVALPAGRRVALLRAELDARAGRLDGTAAGLKGLAPGEGGDRAELAVARARLRWAAGAAGVLLEDDVGADAPSRVVEAAGRLRAAQAVIMEGAPPASPVREALAEDDVLVAALLERCARSSAAEVEGRLLLLSLVLGARRTPPSPRLVDLALGLRARWQPTPAALARAAPAEVARRWAIAALAYEVHAHLDPGAPIPEGIEAALRDGWPTKSEQFEAWLLAFLRIGTSPEVDYDERELVADLATADAELDWTVAVARCLDPGTDNVRECREAGEMVARVAALDPRPSARARASLHALAARLARNGDNDAFVEAQLRAALTPHLASPHRARTQLAGVLVKRGALAEALLEARAGLEELGRVEPAGEDLELRDDRYISGATVAWLLLLGGDPDGEAERLLAAIPAGCAEAAVWRARATRALLLGRSDEALRCVAPSRMTREVYLDRLKDERIPELLRRLGRPEAAERVERTLAEVRRGP